MIKILIIDNYDSFTYNLLHLFQKVRPQNEYLILRHYNRKIFNEDFDRLVISPGPMGPKDTGLLASFFQKIIVPQRIPCFGVCLGMQFLAWYFGHEVLTSKQPVHGQVDLIKHNGQKLFREIPQKFSGARYNSLEVIPKATSPLDIIAQNSDGAIMALEHQDFPFTGVQFHPESFLTDYSVELINNWFSYYV